jgi:predicted ATPase
VRRVVLTGGPGAGKTTLLTELARRGQRTVAESARAIIAARLAAGLDKRPDPASFAREILRKDLEQYRVPHPDGATVFYDRSAVEAIAMVHAALPFADEEIALLLADCAYHPTVFVLPPWERIFVNDAERDHTFAHAVAVHGQLVRWYRRCGYQLSAVPRLTPARRAEHVLRVLGHET